MKALYSRSSLATRLLSASLAFAISATLLAATLFGLTGEDPSAVLAAADLARPPIRATA